MSLNFGCTNSQFGLAHHRCHQFLRQLMLLRGSTLREPSSLVSQPALADRERTFGSRHVSQTEYLKLPRQVEQRRIENQLRAKILRVTILEDARRHVHETQILEGAEARRIDVWSSQYIALSSRLTIRWYKARNRMRGSYLR